MADDTHEEYRLLLQCHLSGQITPAQWFTHLQDDAFATWLTANIAPPAKAIGFQQEVDRWLIACFGEEIARDRIERNHRFIEEALELVQAGGCTASEAHQLVDYVFGRPVGVMHQEVGGVMNTLAALCLAYDLDMVECGDIEIARCWTKVEKIRAKQAAKPKYSPLPEHAPVRPARQRPLTTCDFPHCDCSMGAAERCEHPKVPR